MPPTAQPANFDRAFIDRLLGFLPYVVVFLLALTRPIDLDLGSHLKYGEYVFTNHALLRDNTFTSAMPNYPYYINHAWGNDLLLFGIFSLWGFTGISILGATLISLTFYLLSRAAKLDLWSESLLFPVMMFLLNGVIEQSFRSYYFSFLGIATLYWLLNGFTSHPRRTLCLLPLLFMLWANLHGQFSMGLVLYGIWLFFFYMRKMLKVKDRGAASAWSIIVIPAATFFLSLVATLANPHGFLLYQEIFRHFGNPLQKFVTEWQPITMDQQLLVLFLFWSGVIFFSVFVARMWKDLPNHGHIIVPLLLLFFATFDQRRYFWPMVLLSMPAVGPLLKRLKPSRQSLAYGISFAILGITYLFAAVEKLPAQQLFSFNWDAYCRCNSFSPRSAELLKNIAPGHKLFNDYDLGGWLIWNYPTIKPAIDGRMPFWRDDNGYSAYQEYLALEQGRADIDASPYDLVYWPPHKAALYSQLTSLAAAGKWRHLYDDPFASIFVRNKVQDQRVILGGSMR